MKLFQNTVGTVLSGWTGFSILLRQSEIPPMSQIKYLPIIDGSASEYSTLYSALLKSINIADQLSLEHSCLWFSMKLSTQRFSRSGKNMVNGNFAKFLEFLFTGSINTCSYLLFTGSINTSIIIEVCIATKLMSKALHKLRFQAFLDNVSDEDNVNIYFVVSDLLNNFSHDDFQEKLRAEPFTEILEKYDAFVVQESESNPAFSLWSTYLEMIGILFQFVR